MAIYIKDIRKKRGIKQKDLAETFGVQPNYIARLESGERALTNEWILKLTAALDCAAWELCDDEDYFFTQKNLEKVLKTSINFSGNVNNSGNFMAGNRGEATQKQTAPNPRLDDYETELVRLFRKLNLTERMKLVLDLQKTEIKE